MKRLLLILAVLFSITPAYAVTVPPWWMLGLSATNNGVASFNVDITTSGNIYAANLATGTTYSLTPVATTTYPLSFSLYASGSALVYMDGVLQIPIIDYSLASNTITFPDLVATGTRIYIIGK